MPLLQVFIEKHKSYIRAGKKSCWCCDWLARELHYRGTKRVDFVLSGCHGKMFPWVLPTGVSDAIAMKMIGALKKELVRAVESVSPLIPALLRGQSLGTGIIR